MDNYISDFSREMKNRNYSFRTIKLYSKKLQGFLDYAKTNDYEPELRISKYLEKIMSVEGRRHAYMAIRLFYKFVMKKSCPYKLDKIKKQKRIPEVLSKNEILLIIDKISNPVHRLIILMLYGSGLRVSEIINLKVCDLDLSAFLLKIKDSKSR
jgi:integrase/recombinase XerD